MHETALALLGPDAELDDDVRLDEGLPVRAVGPDLRRAPTRSSATSSPSASSACRADASVAMRFAFTEDQLAFRDAVRDLLDEGVPAARGARRVGRTTTGRAAELWDSARARWACSGCSRPRRTAASASTELDLVLLLEETGRAALPEPLVEHARRSRRCSLDDRARAGCRAARSRHRRRSGDPATSPYADVGRRDPAARRRRRVCTRSRTPTRRSTPRPSVDGTPAPLRRRWRRGTPCIAARTATRALAARVRPRRARRRRPAASASARPHARDDRRVRHASASSSASRSARSRRSSTSSPTRGSRSSSRARSSTARRTRSPTARPGRRTHVSMAKAAAADAADAGGRATRCSATARSATRSSTTSTSG